VICLDCYTTLSGQEPACENQFELPLSAAELAAFLPLIA
jgi:hypothetical protein